MIPNYVRGRSCLKSNKNGLKHEIMKKQLSASDTMNFKLLPEHCITPEGVDMAVPGQSLSVKQILERYTRGVDPAISKLPQYEVEGDTDDFGPEEIIEDLADVTQQLVESNMKIKEIKQRISTRKNESANDDKIKGSESSDQVS